MSAGDRCRCFLCRRWNPRSEHLHRKTYRSQDELQHFASTYKPRGAERRDREVVDDDRGDYEMDFLEFSRYPSYRNGPPQHYHSDDNDLEDDRDRDRDRDRDDHHRWNKRNGRNISPLPSPKKRRGTWDSDRPAPVPPRLSPPSSSSQDKDYDGSFLNSLLERKAKLRGVRTDDSDSPSKGGSKKSSGGGGGSGESSRHCSRSPSTPDSERNRTERPPSRPPVGIGAGARSAQPPVQSPPGRVQRDDPRDKSRKVVSRVFKSPVGHRLQSDRAVVALRKRLISNQNVLFFCQ